METIIYQGQKVEAVEVCEFGGDIALRPNQFVQGDELLYRTKAGVYYLSRNLDVLDVDTDQERRANGRTLVHRLSLTAAGLWAASRMTSLQTLDLRHDLNAALRAPTSTSGTRHFADGSMTVTLHLKPGPAELVRDAAQTCEVTPVRYTYESLAQHAVADLPDDTKQTKAMEATFADNAPEEEDKRTVVNLRHEDGRLYARVPLEPDLEDRLREKAQEEGTDIGTALLNCLRRFHAQELEEQAAVPPTYGVSQSTLETAARCAAKYGRTANEMIVDLLEQFEFDEGASKRAVASGRPIKPGVAAVTERGLGLMCLDDGNRAELIEYVQKHHVKPVQALNDLVFAGVCAKHMAHAGFAELDDNARKLLRKYLTEYPEVDPRDVLDGALHWMLSDPGEGVDWSDDSVDWAKERRLAQEATGKHHVVFSVWLTDEQMSEGLRANFPVSSTQPQSAYFSALMPMEGAPSLTVDGKGQEGFEQAVQHPRESTLVRLDEKADELVRRYLKVTPWEFTAADIINACVISTLKDAFDCVGAVVQEGSLDAEEFDDSSWGYTENAICAATQRRTGKKSVEQRADWSKQDAEAELEPERAEYDNIDATPISPRQNRHAKPNPGDVALLAASAPEEEPLPEEVHTDEPEEGTATPEGEEGK